MLQILRDVAHFAVAVVSHWQGYVTGGTVTAIIALFERFCSKPLDKKTNFAIFVVLFLFVSFFVTWREEFNRAEHLQTQLNARPVTPAPFPTINVVPSPVVIPSAVPVKPKPPAIDYEVRPATKEVSAIIFITAKGDIREPAFQVTCENQCRIENGQYPEEPTRYEIPLTPAASSMGWINFVMPAVIKDGQQAILGINSTDGKPIKVKNVKIIKWNYEKGKAK